VRTGAGDSFDDVVAFETIVLAGVAFWVWEPDLFSIFFFFIAIYFTFVSQQAIHRPLFLV
jgi:hypothetical protein